MNWVLQVLQVKKAEYLRKRKLALETDVELEKDNTEKAEVKFEEVKTNKPDEPVIGHSYGQAAGLKDDLDVDEDVGKY